MHLHSTATASFNIITGRTREIGLPAVIGMIMRDYCRMVDNVHHSRSGNAMSVHVAIGYISIRHEAPVSMGNSVVIIYRQVDSKARHQWSPSIVSTTASPGNPCRPPRGIRHPNPSVKIIEKPPAIMKRSPSPIVIRDPGVTILRVDPIAVGSVRHKTGINPWYPYVPVLAVVHPCTIRL
jgi:hypothetical protein